MVRSIIYIESKGFLVSASSDNLIKATKIDNSMNVISIMSGHYGEVNCITYLYDRGEESFIASGG
jgi:WD40 repeat protein